LEDNRMNINPNAAASVAGTSRAAARGGKADSQASESTRQQSTTENPAGKASQSSAVDAGDQTEDRGGNGRQVLDVFEREEEQQEQPPESQPRQSAGPDGTGEHLDLEA
jgi:hypothetical protein